MTQHPYNKTSLPQQINARARTHTHSITLYLQHEIIQQFSRNHFKTDFCKWNYIYKDSETFSLPTTINIPFSISLACKYYFLNIWKRERHYSHNLNSNITLYFIHRWKTEQNNQSESSLSITTRPKYIFYYAITFQTWTFQLNNEIYVFKPPATNKHHHNCWRSTFM
jgi:hypothetical protein